MNFEFEEHPGDEALELYALNRLGETDAEVFEEHILICEGCRVRLDDADRYVRAMRSAASRLHAEQVRKSSAKAAIWDWFRNLAVRSPAMALTALACVCAAVLIWQQAQHSRPAPDAGLFTVALVSQRGESNTAPAHRRLDLQMDARGLELGAQVRVEIVDASGHTIERATVPDRADRVEMRTTRELAPGSYYVRLFPPATHRSVREFGLELK